jgi:hypothetical protein
MLCSCRVSTHRQKVTNFHLSFFQFQTCLPSSRTTSYFLPPLEVETGLSNFNAIITLLVCTGEKCKDEVHLTHRRYKLLNKFATISSYAGYLLK